jgi:hypothetical protein
MKRQLKTIQRGDFGSKIDPKTTPRWMKKNEETRLMERVERRKGERSHCV